MMTRRQFTVRLDEDVYQDLSDLSEQLGVSRVALIQALIAGVAEGWSVRKRALLIIHPVQAAAREIDAQRRER